MRNEVDGWLFTEVSERQLSITLGAAKLLRVCCEDSPTRMVKVLDRLVLMDRRMGVEGQIVRADVRIAFREVARDE